MPNRCARCSRSLSGLQVYRRRGETFRPGSIMPSTPRHLRGQGVLCTDCWRTLAPRVKRDYASSDPGPRFGHGT